MGLVISTVLSIAKDLAMSHAVAYTVKEVAINNSNDWSDFQGHTPTANLHMAVFAQLSSS